MSSSPCSALVSRQRVCWTGLPVGRVCLISLLSHYLTKSSPRGTTTGTNSAHVILGSSYRYGLGGAGWGLTCSLTHDTGHTRRRNRYILEGCFARWRGFRRVLWSASGILDAYVYDTIGRTMAFSRRTSGIGLDCEAASESHGGEQRQTDRPWCPDGQDCVIWSR